MMASEWSVSAQEAAARLFAHALPIPRHTAHQQQRQNQHHQQQQQQQLHSYQQHPQLTEIESAWWPVEEHSTEDEPDADDTDSGNASWTGWIPCFERDYNENDLAEPILVRPDTPTEEVRNHLSFIHLHTRH